MPAGTRKHSAAVPSCVIVPSYKLSRIEIPRASLYCILLVYCTVPGALPWHNAVWRGCRPRRKPTSAHSAAAQTRVEEGSEACLMAPFPMPLCASLATTSFPTTRTHPIYWKVLARPDRQIGESCVQAFTRARDACFFPTRLAAFRGLRLSPCRSGTTHRHRVAALGVGAVTTEVHRRLPRRSRSRRLAMHAKASRPIKRGLDRSRVGGDEAVWRPTSGSLLRLSYRPCRCTGASSTPISSSRSR